MERASRLRRYLRKDYSQLVDFPVEIVGRDGTVRRYTFGDSVRLYHRRIHSAPMRYDDGDLVEAEIRHCRQRIEQLRRSYLEHFGWGALRHGGLGGAFGGSLAAEVAAFLRTAFVAEREAPASLRVTLLDSGVGDTFYVRCSETGRTWLLYAWRLDAESPPGARDAWQDALARLGSAPAGEGVERLLLASEGPDVAMVLAGSGEWSGPPGGLHDPGPEVEEDAPDPLHAGVRALYDGQPLEALERLEAGLDASPHRLVLAQAASLVALLEDAAERAEFAARFGLLHRASDPLLAYLLAVALGRQGRVQEAVPLVRAAMTRAPRAPLLALLDAVLAIRSGRLLRAWRSLVRVGRADREPRYAQRAAALVRAWLLAWAAAATASVAIFVAALAVAQAGDFVVGATLAVVAVVAQGLAWRRLQSQARAAVAGVRTRGVPRLVSLELLPRDREPDGPH